MSSRSNISAFPRTVSADGMSVAVEGMTIREYFAALAMQGIWAFSSDEDGDWDVLDIAGKAVSQADALIAELAKPVK